MKKIILDRFINKYSLGGGLSSVTIVATDSSISTSSISSDKHVIVDVSTQMEMDAGKYSIFDTSVLKGLLNVLGPDIDLSVKKIDSRPVSLGFKDDSTSVTFVLADETNIPVAPKLKHLPDFENVIVMDQSFFERFVKAKNALPDVVTFTYMCDGSNSTIVFGHSNMNTNKITLKVNTETKAKADPIDFHASYMKEILLANKEASSGKLEISSEGLSRITFTIDDFDATYYLPQIQNEL